MTPWAIEFPGGVPTAVYGFHNSGVYVFKEVPEVLRCINCRDCMRNHIYRRNDECSGDSVPYRAVGPWWSLPATGDFFSSSRCSRSSAIFVDEVSYKAPDSDIRNMQPGPIWQHFRKLSARLCRSTQKSGRIWHCGPKCRCTDSELQDYLPAAMWEPNYNILQPVRLFAGYWYHKRSVHQKRCWYILLRRIQHSIFQRGSSGNTMRHSSIIFSSLYNWLSEFPDHLAERKWMLHQHT